MDIYITIFCIFTAIVIVVMKLILEHQQDVDRANGIEQDPAGYTTKGMIKLIRQERKERKMAKKAAKLEAKLAAKAGRRAAAKPEPQRIGPTIAVREFKKKSDVTEDTAPEKAGE